MSDKNKMKEILVNRESKKLLNIKCINLMGKTILSYDHIFISLKLNIIRSIILN